MPTRRRSATSSTGWSVPTSLLAHITETSATESGSRSIASTQGVGVEAAEASTGRNSTSATSSLGQPDQRVEDRVMFDGGAQDPGPGGRRPGATRRGP